MTAPPVRQDEDPITAAARWYSRKRAGNMDVNNIRALSVWLERDAKHRRAFEAMERMWALTGGIEEDPSILAVRDEGLLTLRRRARTRGLGLTAVVLAFAAGGVWMLFQSGALSELAWFKPPPEQVYRTAIGQRSSVALADGSIVTLDTDTLVRVQLSGRERHVDLERGRAFFQVAKERSRPFVVAAGGKTVRATGTAFDVRVEPGRFQVTLIEGRVFVQERGANSDDGPVADMRPGWRLAIGDDMRWRMEPIDLSKATSWREGNLVFFYDSLTSAAAEMNRYSTRKIVFLGEPPSSVIVGNFRAGDVDSFVRAVKLNKLARVVSETDEGVELAAR